MGEVTSVDTHVEPTKGSTEPTPEAAAAMAAQATKPGTVTRVEANTAPDPKTDRPAWLPEKFKTVEEMAKSYGELEKKLGSKAQEKPVEKAGTPDAPKTGTIDALKLPDSAVEATKALETAGLKMDKFESEFAKEGKLTDGSYEELAKAGIPKNIVDGYIAGQTAIAAQINADLHGIAGGEDKFNEMFEWSKTAQSLSDSDRSAVNKAIDSKDLSQIKLTFKAVHAAWVADVGKEPGTQLRGGTGGGKGADAYTSKDEMMMDMAKPEYQANESFRKQVAAKLKRSNIY